MQETAFVDSQGGLLSSRGGAQTHWHRHIGTSLTRVSLRGPLLKGVAVQGVLYQSILHAKLTGRKKLGRKM